MSPPSLPAYKRDLITLCLQNRILTFGTFTLKSGRTSPYFFNAGLFNTASLLTALSCSYAQTIDAHFSANPAPTPTSSAAAPSTTSNQTTPPQHPDVGFDVLFGPAYKGIPLSASVLVSLPLLTTSSTSTTTTSSSAALTTSPYAGVGYAFNRKEAKAHGEGGSIVGASLAGKRVLIIDDVITAGTAIREAVGIIQGAGGTVVGIVVALDREEMVASEAEKAGLHEEEGVGRGEERLSTVEMVRRDVGVPVLAVLTLGDLIRDMGERGEVGGDEVRRMEEYRARYGAKA